LLEWDGMIQISISELKAHAGRYVELADREEVYITRNGRRVAKLTAAASDKVTTAKALFGLIPPGADLDSARRERLS